MHLFSKMALDSSDSFLRSLDMSNGYRKKMKYVSIRQNKLISARISDPFQTYSLTFPINLFEHLEQATVEDLFTSNTQTIEAAIQA